MKIINKRARFDYEIVETLEAGIVLAGSEAKAVRLKHANLSQSYAKIVGGEVWLINAAITTESQTGNPTRSRKLLLHRNQITAIETKIKAKKLTLVPLALYTKGRLYKVSLALGKSKKKFQKKEQIKKADVERDIARSLRDKD